MEEELLQGRPVRSLQTMLRTLSFYDPALIRLIPDGVFGERTVEAVMAFQRKFHLPVNGIVDNTTWDAIVLAWTAAQTRMRQPNPISNTLDWRYASAPGQSSVYMLLSQSLFKALYTVLDGIALCPVDGNNSKICAQNVRWLQHRGGLRENGVLGKAEWDFLTRLYTVFVLRSKTGRR